MRCSYGSFRNYSRDKSHPVCNNSLPRSLPSKGLPRRQSSEICLSQGSDRVLLPLGFHCGTRAIVSLAVMGVALSQAVDCKEREFETYSCRRAGSHFQSLTRFRRVRCEISGGQEAVFRCHRPVLFFRQAHKRTAFCFQLAKAFVHCQRRHGLNRFVVRAT